MFVGTQMRPHQRQNGSNAAHTEMHFTLLIWKLNDTIAEIVYASTFVLLSNDPSSAGSSLTIKPSLFT